MNEEEREREREREEEEEEEEQDTLSLLSGHWPTKYTHTTRGSKTWANHHWAMNFLLLFFIVNSQRLVCENAHRRP